VSDETKPQPLLTAQQIDAMPAYKIRHPFNPNSSVQVKTLSMATGLKRAALSLARVPPGKESFVYHAHARDEEWLYILSGRGQAEIGDDRIEVGPGDFMGFPAPGGPAHHLLNPYDEDLVYLMGGDRSGFDIGIFPRHGKHLVFQGMSIQAFDDDGMTPMSFDQFFVTDEEDG